MNERRRPHRRGRGPRPFGRQSDQPNEPNPYRDVPDDASGVELAATGLGIPPDSGETNPPPGGHPPDMPPQENAPAAGTTPAAPPDRDVGAPSEGGAYPP